MLHLIPIVSTLIVAIVLYYLIFRYLNIYKIEVQEQAGDRTVNQLQKMNNSLLLISLLGIIFTLIAKWMWSEGLTIDQYLINSWIGFGAVVIIGIFIYISRAGYRAYSKSLKKELDLTEKGSAEGKRLLRKFKDYKIRLISLLYLQSLLFFCALVYLLIFSVINL